MIDRIEEILHEPVRRVSTHWFCLALILYTLGVSSVYAQDSSYTVEFVDSFTAVTSIAQSISLLDNPGDLPRTTRSPDTLNYTDDGRVGEFGGDLLFPYRDTVAVRARRDINVIDSGTYTFGVNSDDGVRLSIDGTIIINDDVLRPPTSSFASLFLTAGIHSVEVLFFENGGSASLELFAASGTHVNFNGNFNLLRGNLSLAGAGGPSAGTDGQWGPVMDWPLVAVSMANLPDGRILTYSGSERRTWPIDERTYSATWDPVTRQFDETLHVGHNMFCAATSMTADGKVFVNGGRNQSNSPWTSVYDSSTSNWTQIQNMASGGRWYPTSLALGDGTIFTAMGSSTNVRNPELWSESSGWRVLNGIDFLNLRQRRPKRGDTNWFPLLSQAPSGDIFHFWDTVENHYIDTAGNGRAELTNAQTDFNDHSGGIQIMYDEGLLLMTGTNDGSWRNVGDGEADDQAFTIDLNGSRPVIRTSQPMNFPRKFHQMIPLPTGEVLVVGGNTTGAKFQDNGSVLNAEIWNPETRQFRVVAEMAIPRDYHSTALLMTNGRVITAGGGYDPSNPNSGGTHQDAQIYSPPYLFADDGQAAVRPTLQSTVDEVGYGQTFSVTASGDIAFFSLIRMSSVTHAVNTDVRMFRPAFTEQANGLYSITMHSNENVATPGYWMLFAVDAEGVPSLAETIRVAADAEPQDPNNGNPPEVADIASSPIEAGSDTNFVANAAGFGLVYNWNFGDGTGDSGFTTNNSLSHRFSEPGRYVVSVTVRTPAGDETVQSFTQVVHDPVNEELPVASSTLVEVVSRSELWNVNPDNNSVGIIGTDIYDVLDVVTVGRQPSALALAPSGRLWVVNKGDATVSVINPSRRTIERTLTLDRNSRPHGIVFNQHSAYIALEGTATVVQLDAYTGIERRRRLVGNFPRHLSLNGAGDRLYVSSFITPPLPGEQGANLSVSGQGGQVHVFATSSSALRQERVILLSHSNRATSENQGPGMPNYLGPVLIAPDGETAMVPSKQDNILRGLRRNGLPLAFDQTVRAITSVINLDTETEIPGARIDHDNASVASHGAYGPYGLTFFTSLEGNRQVALIDATTNLEYARFDTGFAPQSVLLSSSGDELFVHHFMDRSVGVYDVGNVVRRGDSVVTQTAVVNVTDGELLSATAFRGKQLFYDARDDRLAALDYMSCASCHNEAGHDGRSWDFTHLGEGIRNTPTLVGNGGTRNGLLHWSANFDEIQDFEGQIRRFAGGTGLLSDELFNQGTRSQPLGDPKAGLSPDLDALADYLQSLDEPLPSPYRANDGSLTASAERGKILFASEGCATCHAGSSFTDSTATLNLHDIGTLDADSGERLNAPLSGIDTPPLTGAWQTAPYLHDGAASTLGDAIMAHNGVSLTNQERDDLAEYVRQVSPAVDTDGDGLTDDQEATLGTDPNDPDTDNDRLIDGVEVNQSGTNPLNRDTDGDGFDDGFELNASNTDPNNPDSDGDGLTDRDEVINQDTDPNNPDTDGGAVNDGIEVGRGTDPNDPTDDEITVAADTDGDGLTDDQEAVLGTDPNDPDTDNDVLSDGFEVNESGTNPLKRDTDGDGFNDRFELNASNTDPNNPDSDGDGLTDRDEVINQDTDPNNPDTDGGAVNDGVEVGRGTDPTDPSDDEMTVAADTDGDGLSDDQEAVLGTDPNDPDTDNDVLSDGFEVNQSGTNPLKRDTDGDGFNDRFELNTSNTDPNNRDSDGDGLTDRDEVINQNTDPNNPDTDGGAINDGVEVGQGTNPNDPSDDETTGAADTDGDGLSDEEEVLLGTDPNNRDTDNDVLSDGFEVNQSGTDPRRRDTDGDGFNDRFELKTARTDPLDRDSDDDGLTDREELIIHDTNPNNPDTDGGGASDGLEIRVGNDPLDERDDFLNN